MTWKDDRNLGPWNFIEQQDKWGYLNNKRWSLDPAAVRFSADRGNPSNLDDRHEPCGHWHKDSVRSEILNIGPHWWYQPSIDVFDGQIALVPMYYDADPAYDGIVALIYDVATRRWVTRGYPKVMQIYGAPQTCRITSKTLMYYYVMCWAYDWYGDPGDPEYDKYYGRLYKFQSGSDPTYVDIWPCDYATGIPYEIAEQEYYNVMDCAGSRIACAARMLKVAGVPTYEWRIKISDDYATTFHTEWSFPTVSGPNDQVQLRMSRDGIVWVAYLRSDSGTATSMIELWKSNAGATNFTKIWERDYYADVGNRYLHDDMTFDVSDADGRYVTIVLYSNFGGDGTQGRYTSINYGVAFNVATSTELNYWLRSWGVSNGQYTIIPGFDRNTGIYYFYRSSDYSVNFSRNGFLAPEDFFFADMQKYNNEFVETECGYSFTLDVDLQGLLYSNDNGATWEVILSPASTVNEPIQNVAVDGVTIDLNDEEPKVWRTP